MEQQPQINSNSLVFLDESGINTDLTRLYGRGKGKSRVWDKTPLNTPKSTTLLSSVRLDGEMICGYFQGPLNGDIFCSYVQEHLVPHLRKGDIVVRHAVKFCVSENRQSQDWCCENSAESSQDPLFPQGPVGRNGMRAASGVNTALTGGTA